MDTTSLQNAYRALLDAAATVAAADATPGGNTGGTSPGPPTGEWNGDQILAHVAVINAVTLTTVASAGTGAVTAYDNRPAQDTWTLGRVTALAGGNTGLRDRIRAQADALCALVGPMLSEAELDTPVPTLLLSHDTLLVDRPVPLRALLTGLADTELPGHTEQLLALLPKAHATPAAAAT